MARKQTARSHKAKARKPAPRPRRGAAKPGPRAGAPSIETPPVGDGRTATKPLTIAGVGMSAGGLEACTQVLEALPSSPGLAIVLIPHLAPHQRSALPSLLSQHSQVPISQAANGMAVEANHAYVLPPDVVMELAGGELRLTPRPPAPKPTHPVDSFFTSLAAVQGENAIGVVLSGTGMDGALGIRSIKERGGTVIAQEPSSAKYDGMPHAAIETGLVDLVLPPADIGRKLVELAQLDRVPAAAQPVIDITDDQFAEVVEMLRATSGVDFAHYKQPTMRRRIARRMGVHHLADVGQYIDWLKRHPEEVRSLYQDILIHVTRFFRDPDSFQALATLVLPKLLDARRLDDPLRVWVAGCATGEEAYSVAMTLFEYAGETGIEPNAQLFGTDVSEAAVDFARQGTYPGGIADDVPADKLRRFFTRADGGYRISKAVRDRCVFARQDLTRDAPFSRLDLIVCRNVLIYMDASLQRKVMGIFHYALKPTGYLLLGQAETTGAQADFFTLVEKKHRIYRKRPYEHVAPSMPMSYPMPGPPPARSPAVSEPGFDVRSLQDEANRALLDRYGPPGVLVNDALDVVQFRGHTGEYLEPPPGDANLSLLKLVREGLLHGVRSALQAARKTRRPVRKEGLRVRSTGVWTNVDVEVIPLTGLRALHFLVMFDRPLAAHARQPAGKTRGAKPSEPSGRQARRLEEELASTREYLQSIIQEVEAANEELQSANEEILSSNEELQSTNEELDTAKEELQSTNEELNTLNEELHARNDELTRVNNDLVNLLGSVQIAIVIVSGDLRVRRFTPMAEKLMNLIPADVGRPITQVKPNIDVADLGTLIREVVDKVQAIEREVRDADGRWYSLRIRPYKGLENRIEGAVVALFDIDSAKRHEIEARQTRDLVDAIMETITEPVAIVDGSLRIRSVNRAFRESFRVTGGDAEGRFIYELRSDGSLSAVRSLLETVALEKRSVEGFELRQPAGDGRQRTLVVDARPIGMSEFGETAVLVAFHDVTGRSV